MKKIISVFLALSIMLSCLFGCSSTKNSSIATLLPNSPKPPKTGPVGTWDIPVPEINPLGSQSLYTTTKYEKDSHLTAYIQNFCEYEKNLDGEIWTLEVNDPSGVPLEFLEKYAKKLGAKVFANSYGDRLVFSYEKDNNALWWGDAIESDKGYELTVIKQQIVSVGKAYTIKPPELNGEKSFSFLTQSKNNRFQSVTVKADSGTIKLEAADDLKINTVTSKKDFSQTLETVKTNTFVLDNIPQGEGSLQWKIDWSQGEEPKEISFLIEELYDIPPVKTGEAMGELVVKGVPFGAVTVKNAPNTKIENADGYSYEGNITLEGDTQFWLPAGYWTVESTAQGIGLESTRSRIVPVSSGESTVFTVPDNLKSSYSRLNSVFAEAEDLTAGIEILKAADNGATATVSMQVNDPQKRDIFPDKNNTVIYENGTKVQIEDIARKVSPPSVMLVLDSSGSMGELMKSTLESAKSFISGLPDQSYVKVIDFDSQVRVLNGETKDTAIKSLAGVTSGGSTMLFDAVAEGLNLLEGKTRPAVVVFADGADSSLDGQGAGSTSTVEEIVQMAGEAQIPLYTIGFGENPDANALKQFAAASAGEYFAAKDPKTLQSVFTAIGGKFGNSFDMTYTRPKEAAVSETPVISMVIDNSGSMDIDPAEEEGCGFRMEKAKALFHSFVSLLPKNALMQLTSFSAGEGSIDGISQQQLTTQNKAEILQGLADMQAGGGTPILDSLRICYENLIPVPSSKKVMVYLTDAALEVDEEQKQEFEDLLGEIKKQGITVLFAGMGVEDKESVFARAAELAGGDYVISEDTAVLNAALEKLLANMQQKQPSEFIPISVSINETRENGEQLRYAASYDAKLSQPKKSGQVLTPDVIKLSTGTPVKLTDNTSAKMLTGMSVPSADSKITSRIEFNKKQSNKAVEINVKNGFYLDKLMGLDAPSGRQFMALQLELSNITPEKIDYKIQSIFNHFYVGINAEGCYPASEATWLAEKPLSPPGNPEVTVPVNKPAEGVLVFLVPSGVLTQQTLNFYDTAYGHISITLSGAQKGGQLDLESLPTQQVQQLSDTFGLKLTNSSTKDTVDIYKAESQAAFKVIEGELSSKVQAILDIEPKDRIWFKTETAAGPFMSKLSDVTQSLPLGFLKQVNLAPGSNSHIRLAYDIPAALAKNKSSLYLDLATGSTELAVSDGGAYGAAANGKTFNGQGLSVKINQLTTQSGSENCAIIADVTFTDNKDGEGTYIPQDFFKLVKAGHNQSEQQTASSVGLGSFAGGDDNEKLPSPRTDSLIYGIDSSWSVFDGTQRRGLIAFDSIDEVTSWSLQSSYIKEINIPLTGEPYAAPELLALKSPFEINDEFESNLSGLVSKAIEKYNAANLSENIVHTEKLNSGDGGQTVPMPSITAEGMKKIKAVTNEKEFYKTVEALQWVAADASAALNVRYAPEAVLTQNWGSEWDLANTAMGLLSKCGFAPKLRNIKPTDKGLKKLREKCGVGDWNTEFLPAVAYQNEKGEVKLFVIPFMKEITELDGLVYITSKQKEAQFNLPKATITVSARVESKNEAGLSQAAAADVAAALGGGEGQQQGYDEIALLTSEIPLETLSLDAVDVTFMPCGKKTGQCYGAALSTINGIQAGDMVVDTGKNKIVGIRIDVKLPEGSYVHRTTLKEGETPDKLFHTIAVNLPDLPKNACETLQTATAAQHKAANNPNALSIMKWYGRNIFNRFISCQTAFDQDSAKGLKLTLGRTEKARCMVLTSYSDSASKKLFTSMDLLQAVNQCHNGDNKTKAAYNVGAGLFVSELEAKALTADNKASYMTLWTKAPKDASLAIIMNGEGTAETLDQMQKDGSFPVKLMETVEEGEKIVITPTKPTEYEGRKRWAWLEINPITYETISVFDTGEHSGMASYAMSLMPSADDYGQYIVGALIGVDVAVWAIADMSLITDDYKEIITGAKQIAESCSKALDAVMKSYTITRDVEIKIGGMPETDVNGNPVNFVFQPEFSLSAKGFKVKPLSQNFIGFKQGFDDAVKLYFKTVK